MPEFDNIQNAFQWWIENVYPDLAPAEKLNLRYFKYKLLSNRPLSRDKMLEIMEKHSSTEIMIKINK
jgi:hypothetical protein